MNTLQTRVNAILMEIMEYFCIQLMTKNKLKPPVPRSSKNIQRESLSQFIVDPLTFIFNNEIFNLSFGWMLSNYNLKIVTKKLQTTGQYQ